MAINRELTQIEKKYGLKPQWDSFDLLMKDNVTEEEKIVHMDLVWYGPYIWQEGNFACDCNRGDFFYRDDDSTSMTELDFPCSRTRFDVKKVIFPDGTEEMID